MYLVIDFETSGFISKSLPPEHEDQAHIVAVGYVLLDDNLNQKSEWSFIVKCNKINPGAEKVHGISSSRTLVDGIDEREAVEHIHSLLNNCHSFVAYNVDFDADVFWLACQRHSLFTKHQPRLICCMQSSRNVCKIDFAKPRAGEWKNPKLSEAYNFFFGVGLTEAHSALGDARATADIFRALIQGGHITPAAPKEENKQEIKLIL